MFKKIASGTIKSVAFILLGILAVSYSRITNGRSVDNEENEPASGRMFLLHVTPFIVVGITTPGSGRKMK